MRTPDIKIDCEYSAGRPHGVKAPDDAPYWCVRVLEVRVPIQTSTRYEGRREIPVIKNQGVRVVDELTGDKHTLAAIDIYRTWTDHEARQAEKRQYEAEQDAYEQALRQREIDTHLTVLAALEKGGAKLTGMSEGLAEELGDPTHRYSLTAEHMIELLGLLGLTERAAATTPAAPVNPRADTSPPSEYKSARGRDRQTARFVELLGVLEGFQAQLDAEPEVETPIGTGTVAPWTSASRIVYTMKRRGWSEATVRRTLTELGTRGLVRYRHDSYGGGWQLTRAGREMAIVMATAIPDSPAALGAL